MPVLLQKMRVSQAVKDRLNVWTVCFVICLTPLMAHAGGLGMAPLVAIGGAMHLLTRSCVANDQPFWKVIPDWGWVMAAFLGWVGLSYLWSPYEDPKLLKNAIVLILCAALFFPCVGALKRAMQLSSRMIMNLGIGAVFLLSLSLSVDLLSGYGLTFKVDPLRKGEDLHRKLADADMNTGHGIVVLALMCPAIVMMLIRRFKYGWVWGGLLVLGTGYIAIQAQLDSVQYALLISVPVFIMAFVWPRLILKGTIGGAIASIGLAPMIGVWAASLSAEQKALLPLSWEHRAEAWSYVGQRIIEKPVFGYGFDASRSFSETFILRDVYELPIISLHPHNAGLHIWLETGLIGAGLSSLFVYLLGRQILKMAKAPLVMAMISAYIIMAVFLCAVSFGVWQVWWWATLIFTATLLQISLIERHAKKNTK